MKNNVKNTIIGLEDMVISIGQYLYDWRQKCGAI